MRSPAQIERITRPPDLGSTTVLKADARAPAFVSALRFMELTLAGQQIRALSQNGAARCW
jgi:hypothetical protein